MSATPTRVHTFDGISEFDNRLPNWWLWTFYVAILFAIAYWVFFHSLGIGDLPSEAYDAEQRQAAARLEAELAANPITEESLLALAKEPAFVAEGKRIFQDMTKCALCHRPDGSGLGAPGPNLTDDMWIYGGKPMDIFATIRDGRDRDPVRGTLGGMQAWSPNGMQFVLRTTAYVLSIKNTNVQPGKAPEPYAKKEQ
jgi:cytochrome c oxidase cbb3-type subunit III